MQAEAGSGGVGTVVGGVGYQHRGDVWELRHRLDHSLKDGGTGAGRRSQVKPRSTDRVVRSAAVRAHGATIQRQRGC